MERVVLHSDCNNFYASVECLFNPELRGKPMAVVGDPDARHGIVLAKSYAARKRGVRTGNPLWRAKQLCPDIIFVKPNFQRYLKFSRTAREIYEEYTDKVESFGLDECWLDVSGSGCLFGDGKKIADELRSRMKRELGITISVGVSFNKIFAKLGSDYKKPDATTVISRGNWKEMVWPLSVGELLYVGPAAQRKLEKYSICTIGELANTSPRILKGMLGKAGEVLWAFANGLDASPVNSIGEEPAVKSVGNSTTAPKPLVTDRDIKITLYLLCESVAERLREQNFQCKTLQISIRYEDLWSCERQVGLDMPVCNSKSLFQAAYELICRHRIENKPIRSLGVRGCDISLCENIQASLYREAKESQCQDRLEKTMDNIRRRFGNTSIRRGIVLADGDLAKDDPKNHVIHPVGYF